MRALVLAWPAPDPDLVAALRLGEATRIEVRNLEELEARLSETGHHDTVVVVVLSSSEARAGLAEVLVRLEGVPFVVAAPSAGRWPRRARDGDLDAPREELDLATLLGSAVHPRPPRAHRERPAGDPGDEGQERFRQTVERIVDGLVIVDAEGRIRFANSAAHDLFGRVPGALIGEELGFPVVPGETAEVDILRQGETPRVAELRVADTHWDERPARLVSIRDITERRAEEERARTLLLERTRRRSAEAALERSEFRARAGRLLGGSLDPEEILLSLPRLMVPRLADLAVVDLLEGGGERVARRHVEVRDDLLRLLPPLLDESPSGAPPFEAAPRRVTAPDEAWLARLFPPAQARAVARLLPTSALVLPVREGERVHAVLSLVTFDGGAGATEMNDHLTVEVLERARVALEQARLFRTAEEASHAKSDFLNVISHELRTPLNGIVGYADLLREELGGADSGLPREYIAGIERNSRKLLGVIDQILLFARTRSEGSTIELLPEPLQGILDDVHEVMAPLAVEAGLDFHTSGPEEPVIVRTDREKVRQILIHLLGNAIRFTPKGVVRLDARVRGDALTFRVSDTGVGIPAERIASVFEPFAQLSPVTTREVGGMGIGLNVVKNLARMLGGTVDVESSPGRGSTFTVRLPLPG